MTPTRSVHNRSGILLAVAAEVDHGARKPSLSNAAEHLCWVGLSRAEILRYVQAKPQPGAQSCTEGDLPLEQAFWQVFSVPKYNV